MKIEIETIPHEKQRYPTVGDWYWEGDVLRIKVSALPDWKQEALVAIHELVEVMLCESAGITQVSVDAFDKAFEQARKPGNVDEPGDDPKSPYAREHGIATGVERIVAAAMGVSWQVYAEEVEALP